MYVRSAPCRDEETVGLERLARCEVDSEAGTDLLSSLAVRIDEHADPFLLEPLAKQRACVAIEPGQNAVVVRDDRHVGAHAVEELPELDPDCTSAEDDEALGDVPGPDRFAARPEVEPLEPLDRWHG